MMMMTGPRGNRTDANVSQLVIVNPSHVDHTVGIGQDLDVVTGDATIGSTIDECTTVGGQLMLGDDDCIAEERKVMVKSLWGSKLSRQERGCQV